MSSVAGGVPESGGLWKDVSAGLGQHRAAPQPSSLELILFMIFFNSSVQFQYKL